MTSLPATPLADDLHLPTRLDGLLSWAELDDVLHDDWLSVRDGRGRELIRVRDGLGLVDGPGLLRARERRALHRSGFRRERTGELRVWVWLAPDHPPPHRGDVRALLRQWQERRNAVRTLAVQVVRDVLGADLGEVCVVLLPDEDEDDGWDE